jgi:hypothetical protein
VQLAPTILNYNRNGMERTTNGQLLNCYDGSQCGTALTIKVFVRFFPFVVRSFFAVPIG